MIARLRGEVDRGGESWVVLDVGGVGYQVWTGSRQLAALEPGTLVTMHVSTQVREDAFLLYGFPDPSERDTFELLLTVAGVGPKAALALIGTLSLEELRRSVEAEDATSLARAPGIGPKTARRLVVDLKGRIAPPSFTPTPVAGRPPPDALPLALARLGYRKSEIDTALAALQAQGQADSPLEQRLGAALRVLSRATPPRGTLDP